MKIASVTITSESKGKIIGDCLKSVVDHVDANIIVVLDNTGCEKDDTLDVARAVCGDKLMLFHYDAADFSCGDARNFALKCAEESGFDWAFQLDTDERFMPDGSDLRKTLETLPKELMTASLFNADNTYERLLLFRLPLRGYYRYHVHEEWSEMADGTIRGMRYWELPKNDTPEEARERHKRMLDGLNRQVEDDPQNPRWFYYLGQVYSTIGEFDNALESMCTAYSLCEDKHNDLRAWVCFCAANLYLQLKDFGNAICWAYKGVVARPDVPELYTTIAKAYGSSGALLDAITMCELAISQSPENVKRRRERSGFAHLPASFEEPYQIMAEVYAVMGETRLSEWAKKEAMRQEKKRREFRR